MVTPKKKISNKYLRILYSPLAIAEWSFYTIIGLLGGIFIIAIATPTFISATFTQDKETINDTFDIVKIPFVAPVEWLYNYITKGEIGDY